MSQAEDDSSTSFFQKERDKLSHDIISGFEELLLTTNGLNRKLEEILGMTKEYDTVADLWSSFYELMKSTQTDDEFAQDGK